MLHTIDLMRPTTLILARLTFALASLALLLTGGCATSPQVVSDNQPTATNAKAKARAKAKQRRARRARERARAKQRARRAARKTPAKRYEFPDPPRPASPGFRGGVPRARLQPVKLSSRRPDRLRSYVGRRDDLASDVEFALRASASVGAAPEGMRIADADELLDEARKVRALHKREPRLGDLVVFNRVGGVRGARVVGVVVNGLPDGTVEFVFLWKGVVRRGYLNRRRADELRDPAGRALNTFVLGDRAWGRPGSRYLAGQLWSTYIRSRRLRAPNPELVVGQAGLEPARARPKGF